MPKLPADFLVPGQVLRIGDYIPSKSELFYATILSDGTFCVYSGSGPDKCNGLSWSSDTRSTPGDYRLIMQTDGNMCIYQFLNNVQGMLLWQSNTPGGQSYAVMQDDANFCIYAGSGPTTRGGFRWGTIQLGGLRSNFGPRQVVDFLLPGQVLKSGSYLSSRSGAYYATVSFDGTFCVYAGGSPDTCIGLSWSSNKKGTPDNADYRLIMQTDGNLCIYGFSGDKQGALIWQSATPGPQSFVIMQDDGNLCIYGGSGPTAQGDFRWGTIQLGGLRSNFGPKQVLDFLLPGQILRSGDYVTSRSGAFYATVLYDGSFCVYAGSSPATCVGLSWRSDKKGTPDNTDYRMIMQTDGNLCVYSFSGGRQGALIWQSGTPGPQSFAIMQDDGNFCLYAGGNPATAHGFRWGTIQLGGLRGNFGPVQLIDYLLPGQILKSGSYLSSASGKFYTTVLNDGTLNICAGNGPDKHMGISWSSNKKGAIGDYRMIMQTDGNLCIYSFNGNKQGALLWQSGTPGPVSFLIMQDDANLCIYAGTKPATGGVFRWGTIQLGGLRENFISIGATNTQLPLEVVLQQCNDSQFLDPVTNFAEWSQCLQDVYSIRNPQPTVFEFGDAIFSILGQQLTQTIFSNALSNIKTSSGDKAFSDKSVAFEIGKYYATDCLILNGDSVTHSFVMCGNKAGLHFDGNAPYSLLIWIKFNGSNNGDLMGRLVSDHWDGGEVIGGYLFMANGDSLMSYRVADPFRCSAPCHYWGGQRFFLATTFDGNVAKVYLDGKLVGTQSFNGQLTNAPGDAQFIIGSCYRGDTSTFDNSLKANIGRAAVFNRALDPDELSAISNVMLTGTEANLAAYWDFTQKSAVDLSGNGNDGTLVGTATFGPGY